MSDALDRGITVTEMAPMGQPIDVLPETTAAFIGRALRGPLNHPVLISSFGEFRRRFGDIWTRSSLGPAVKQFFDHGGSRLYVVRVANNARGAMICLPASGSALVLRALEPGSTERVRAAVDYDGVDADDDELFNLTLQRVDPQSGRVTDQEIIRHANFREDADNFIADLLSMSALARVEHPYPAHRPAPTAGPDVSFGSAYVEYVQEGSDGLELSDYDLIGSGKHETGLFALQQLDHFDLLYLPPPGKGRDLGPASVLAAEMFCRQRGAMLIADPAADWTTPDEAIGAMRAMGFASPNMIGYFPRMHLRDGGDDVARAVGGALAGLLCKLDRTYGPWQDLDQHGMGFSRDLLPAIDVDDGTAQILWREGLNVIASGPAGKARMTGSVTLGRGRELHRKFVNLPVRRLCLGVVGAIERATRWAVFEHDETNLVARLRSQVFAYLAGLADMGAFENDRFVVECDMGLPRADECLERGVTVLIVFQPLGCTEPVSFTLHQTMSGSRVTTTAFAPVMEDCA